MVTFKLNHMKVYFLGGDDIKNFMEGAREENKILHIYLTLEFTCHYWSWHENEKTCLLVQVIMSSRMFVRYFVKKKSQNLCKLSFYEFGPQQIFLDNNVFFY